jgi:hypothetical protein
MLVNISDAFPLDTLISRPQILKNPHDIYPDTGGCSIEHDLGGSREVKVIPTGVGELPLRMAAKRAHKDSLGRVGVRAVAGSGASIALSQAQLDPVGGTRDAAMEGAGDQHRSPAATPDDQSGPANRPRPGVRSATAPVSRDSAGASRAESESGCC